MRTVCLTYLPLPTRSPAADPEGEDEEEPDEDSEAESEGAEDDYEDGEGPSYSDEEDADVYVSLQAALCPRGAPCRGAVLHEQLVPICHYFRTIAVVLIRAAGRRADAAPTCFCSFAAVTDVAVRVRLMACGSLACTAQPLLDRLLQALQ